ncbi:hypothetical protein [Microbacterium sp. IEGM 1404]|uniref:hypothetical protein n=1 Tax=Microbacterium sp. IEGM 1404 TaxID=3047084 RepID=UPI0024B63EA7|nr:hypothetical protein [Microbacterium sp. IEGM 1404]MDI9889958.1 hypothetical protein [Microbacterium sp. IEGM 1404]
MAEDFTKKIMREISDAMHEQMAQAVADAVREEGLASADQVEISTETDDPSMPVDVARVRRRANQLLGL